MRATLEARESPTKLSLDETFNSDTMSKQENPETAYLRGIDVGLKLGAAKASKKGGGEVDLTMSGGDIRIGLLAAQQPPPVGGNGMIYVTMTDHAFNVDPDNGSVEMRALMNFGKQSHAVQMAIGLTSSPHFSPNDANIILIKKTSAAHPAGGGRIFRDQDDGEYALATDADKRSKADAVDLDSFVMLIQMQARPMSMAAGPKAMAKGGKPGHSDDTKPGFVDGDGRKHFTDCNKCHSYGHWTAGCTD